MSAISRRTVLSASAGLAAALGVAGLPVATAHAARPAVLKVLAYNIWLGGSVVRNGVQLVADVIRDQQADIVLLSESGDTTAKLAALLSTGGQTWSYVASGDTGVLTHLPIIERAQLPYMTKAVIDVDGREVAAYAGHFEYRWYATYLPRGYGGGSADGPFAQYGWDQIPTGPVDDLDAILADNARSKRPDVIRAFLADADAELARRRSVIFGGDFNEPSVLDWTTATKDLHDHNGLVIPWQSTTLLRDAGYTDAYRSVFPNPVSHPGMTWPADNPDASVEQLAWAPKADERDRIDYIFASPSPGLKLVDAGIIGPSRSIVRGERVADATDDVIASPTPWTSDHKAVLATYLLAGPKPRKNPPKSGR